MELVGIGDIWLQAYFQEGNVEKVRSLLETGQEEPSFLLMNQVVRSNDSEMIAAFEEFFTEGDFEVLLRVGLLYHFANIPRFFFKLAVKFGLVYELFESLRTKMGIYDILSLVGDISSFYQEVAPDIAAFMSDYKKTISVSKNLQPPDSLLDLLELYPENFSFDVIEEILKFAPGNSQRLAEFAVSIENFFQEQQLEPATMAWVIKLGVLGSQPELYPEAWAYVKSVLDQTKTLLPQSLYQVAAELALIQDPQNHNQNMALLIMSKEVRKAGRYFQEFFLGQGFGKTLPDLRLDQNEHHTLEYILSELRNCQARD